mmetsp:Transcript_6972/g.7973  ORF Transcript_6972/g.7973 Transcript_6972/m.7973 type:complete len:1665 (-) Transcript_6972:5-4999(-)
MLSSTVQAIQAGFRAITPRSKDTNKLENSESLLLRTPRSNNKSDITTPGTASTADITANTTTSSISSSITTMMSSDHDIVDSRSSSSGMNANASIKRTIVASSKQITMEEDEREVISKSTTKMTGEGLISRTATEEEESPPIPITPAELWPVLDREMRLNMGNSVRCGICISTVTNPVRTKCMHTFCRECITGYLRVSKRSVCPACNTSCTKRSLEPDEEFSNLADAYKDLLRAFGLAPGTYCPEITTMTQKVDFGIKNVENDDDDDDDDDSNDNEFNPDSDRARFDLLCVATTYQVEALPNCQEIICSKLQVEENKQVVNANFEACCDVNGNFEFNLKNMIPKSISFKANTAKSDSSPPTTTGSSITNYKSTDSKSKSKQEHVPSILLDALPNTQDNQEQAREQLEADREMQESMEEVEHHAFAEKLESMAKNVETTRSLLKKDDIDDDDDKFFTLRRSSVLGSDSTNDTFTSAKSHNDDDDDDDEVGSEIFATATQGTDSQETNYGDGSQDKRFDFSTGKITIRNRRDRVRNIGLQEREYNRNELPSSFKKALVSSSVSLQGLNGLRVKPQIIKKKVRMVVDNNNNDDYGKEEPLNKNNNNKDIFDGPSPSPPTPVPSPPLFARIDTGRSKRHTRKSFSKRDNRPKQKQASPISTTLEGSESVTATATVNNTESSSSLSPFKTGSLSPIDHEASFWVDEKPLSTTDNRLNDDRSPRRSSHQQQQSPSYMSTTQRPIRRCSSLGINVTGMIEDSMGGLHMMSMSNLRCSSQQEKENNDNDGEDGTAAKNNDGERNEEEKNASFNDNDGDDGNNNNDESNDEDLGVPANEDNNDNENSGGGGDIPNGADDDDDDTDSVDKTVAMTGEDDQEEEDEKKGNDTDENKDKDKKESDTINNAVDDLETHEPRRATNVTDELHKSTKNEIGKAANLPAGPQIKKDSRRRPEKKTLFAHHDDKNDDIVDVTMNDEDKKPEATEELKEAPTELPPSPATTITSSSNKGMSVDDVNLAQGSNKKNKVEVTSAAQATGMPGLWSKGTIVNVEPRTWPGMNKPGGVGRIVAINPDGSYNVAYILGGKESNVEAIFMVKVDQENDSHGTSSSPGVLGAAGPARRRRRTKDELDALPEDLLRQLAKEGFDTGVSLKSIKCNKKQKKNRIATLSDTTNAGGSKRQDRKKAPKNTATITETSKNKVSKRKRKNTPNEVADNVNPLLETMPSAKKRSTPTPKSDTTIEGTSKNKRPKRKLKNAPTEIASSASPSLETKHSAENRSTPASKSATPVVGTSKSKRAKRKPKNAPTEIAVSINPSLGIKPRTKKRGTPKAKLEWAQTEGNDIPKPESGTNNKIDFLSGGSGGEARELPLDFLLNMSRKDVIMHADERYKQIIQHAIMSKSVTIVTSNLSDEDKAILKTLCTKNFTGDLTIKTTETINKKTTLCIVPTEPDSGSDNVRACVRTLKVMKSALAGIPIVTTDWLRLCEKEKKIKQPEIFVRSLPTKNTVIGNSEDTAFGVAKLAASWNSQQSKTPVLPFQNTFVYLCGSYSSDKRKNLQDLLKEGGAKILTTGKSVSSKVKDMVALNEMSFSPSSGRIIVLCGDSGVTGTLSKSVERDLKVALEGEEHWPSPKTVTVVDSQWVIESVTCAKPLPATSFEPSINKDLWQLGIYQKK